MEALFPLGQTVITQNALATVHPEDVKRCLDRHSQGDWGELDEHDRNANAVGLAEDLRLFSVYHDRNAVKFYVITEADRSVTTVLLPEDY